MKVLIVEEALKSLHGHWFQYISDIVNGGREAGLEIEVAVHKDACPEILRTLPCRPILSSTIFAPATKSKGIRRVVSHNVSLYRDLKAFFAAGNSFDVVIAPTVRLDHLIAYGWLALRFQNRAFGKLVLIMIDSIGQYSSDYSQIHFPAKLLPLKCVLQVFRWRMKRRPVHLAAESEGHARLFEKFCGINFPVIPHVTVLPSLEPFRTKWKKTPGDPPVLGVFGFTRFDKGLDILQAAVKILLKNRERPAMSFVLQWTGDYQLPDGSWIRKDPMLENSTLVQFIPAFSFADEYYQWLVRTDIMVLPYRKDFYYDKLSRVAIDAALAGMPIVYPAGTWLESFVRKYASGIAFQPEKPESLATAIQETLANLSELKTRAKSRKRLAGEAFSARAFFDVIGALPGARKG